MKFRESGINGAFFVAGDPRRDGTTGQTRLFCARSFLEHGLDARVGHSAIGRVTRRGTLRGMHMERGETKLVRCLAGKIFHVLIDLRESSRTFGKWEGSILKEDDERAVYVPPGIAYGFQALTSDVVLLTQLSGPGDGGVFGVRWDDPYFGISWPISEAVVSQRDAAFAPFEREQLAAMLVSTSKLPAPPPSLPRPALALDIP